MSADHHAHLPGDLDTTSYPLLVQLLDRLDRAGLPYDIKARPASVRVLIRPPGWHWDIKFSPDGDVEIERFRSIGPPEHNPAILDDLFSG